MIENKDKGRMAIIGDKDSVLAFKALGMRVFSDLNPFAIKETLKKLAREECAVVLITEKAARLAGDAVDKYKTHAFPVIIPIPDATGTDGYGMQAVRDNVEKVIGSDILLKDAPKDT